jgi:uncharacterized oxidoreductase
VGELRELRRARIRRGRISRTRKRALVGDHLVDANLAGHDSHGVIRVAKYLDWQTPAGMVLQPARASRAESPRTPSSTAASAMAR